MTQSRGRDRVLRFAVSGALLVSGPAMAACGNDDQGPNVNEPAPTINEPAEEPIEMINEPPPPEEPGEAGGEATAEEAGEAPAEETDEPSAE